MNKNKLSEIPNKIRQLEIFSPETGYRVDYLQFCTSDIGMLWQKIPFDTLSGSIISALKKQGKHVPSWGWLDIRGALAAQVLKSYWQGMSDSKFIELMNQSPSVRWFCFMNAPMSAQIKDKDLLVRWRQFLGEYMPIDILNKDLLVSWKDEIPHLDIRLTDATAYEVKIAHPHSVSLLWESCEWVYKEIHQLSKALGQGGVLKKQYRKWDAQKARQMSYAKRRKKTHQQTKSRKQQLLYWLDKGLTLLTPLATLHKAAAAENKGLKSLKNRFYKRLDTITKVYAQQQAHFDEPESKIIDRIVSLQQPHIRPIVRGKANKPVEFGPKVNMLQIGGINLIDKISFDAFNESNRFQSCCMKYTSVTGKPKMCGADAIYATNKNRTFATKQGILTNFAQKGKTTTDETIAKQIKVARQTIGKLRATRMEGSFGNEKEHYGLRKINAKTPQTQLATLFCATLTANAMALVNNDKRENRMRNGSASQNARAA